MKDSIVAGLLQNTAILLALSLVYDYLWIKNNEPKNFIQKIHFEGVYYRKDIGEKAYKFLR